MRLSPGGLPTGRADGRAVDGRRVVHGVLNTDNINVTGESFDYGPWRFLPVYDPKFTAAYFDETGLYAFGRQPDTLLWNLYRLAECLLALAPQSALEQALRAFEPALHREFTAALLRRLGLQPAGNDRDGRGSPRRSGSSSKPQKLLSSRLSSIGVAEPSAPTEPRGAVRGALRRPPRSNLRAAFDELSPVPGLRLDHPYFLCSSLDDADRGCRETLGSDRGSG